VAVTVVADVDLSSEVVEGQLAEKARVIEDAMEADLIAYVGPIVSPGELQLRYAVESRKDRRKALVVVLETYGGYMETAERMATVFRGNYKRVDFVVPNFAFSAGTILTMAGDAIHMDYFSVLGPIDPQAERKDGQLVPALGYLAQFNRLIDDSHNRLLTEAELTYLLNFDAAELYRYEQERELSIDLLKDWLVQYKFKDWKITEGRKTEVTPEMRKARAGEVAQALQNPGRWHSHGRGISMTVLTNDLKLLIDDFGKNDKLKDTIPDFYRLLKDYMTKMGHPWVIFVPGRYAPVIGGY
jgi:Serine dehydrogenase proteinase